MWMDVFLDPDHPRQTSALLYEQIRCAVAEGRLRVGERLPTTRSLADDLGIARSTVATVFGRLVAEGVLVARVGDGTYVAEQPVGGPEPRSRRPAVSLTRRPPPPVPSPDAVEPAQAVDVTADLRTGRPDPNMFPVADWRRAVKRATVVPPPGYGDPAGMPALRAAIATWVARSRGLDATADQVLVTNGAQQAFDLCARVLVAGGDRVAFEEPGYEPARRAFLSNGATVEPVRVDRDGLVVAEIPDGVRAVYVTPSHQSPTGVTMSAQRRRALLDRAHRERLTIIEDDYDTEYRYVDRPIEPLHRLDRHGHVVYVGTFSKTLSPSLRIGFVIASSPVIDDLVMARRSSDGEPPHLTQMALTELMVNGALDRHIRRTRAAFRSRHDLVQRRIADLHRHGLIAAPWPSKAGLHAMIELHEEADAGRIRQSLAEHGVVIDSVDRAWFGPARPALTIGFGLADEPKLARAFDLLDDTLRDDLLRRVNVTELSNEDSGVSGGRGLRRGT